MPANPTRAAVYLRMSTIEQEGSIERQLSQVLPYAEKRGYEVVERYEDPAIAGDEILRRREFQRMLRDAQRGHFDVILCDDKDRFGRFDTIDMGEIVAPLRRKGVWLETCAQGKVDWTTFSGRITDAILQEAKKIEAQAISRRTLTALLLRAERGEPPGGVPPYGYRVEEKEGRRRYVPGDAYHVQVVRWIFEKIALEGWTVGQVQEELRQRGVAPPVGNGYGKTKSLGIWDRATIRVVLRNRAYVGDLVYNKLRQGKYSESRDGVVSVSDTPQRQNRRSDEASMIIRENTHEPLIDRDTFTKAQEALTRNRHMTSPKKRGEGRYLLTRLLICGHCGAFLTGRKDHNIRAYYCGSRLRLGKTVCRYKRVHEDVILGQLVAAIQAEYLNPDRLGELRTEMDLQEREALAGRGEAALVRQRLDQLEQDISQGRENVLRVPTDLVPGLAVTLSGWEAERDRLQRELKRLVTGKHHAERKEVLRVAEEQLWKWRERISSSDPETVRALLLELVDRVEVFFVEKARGKRRYMAFDLGVIYPKEDPSYGTSRS